MKTQNVTIAHLRERRILLGILHAVVIVLSLALIVFISYDTFARTDFLQNHAYMTFQFWVCLIFLAIYFVDIFLTPRGRRWRYALTHLFFFIISIPYLNIINFYGVQVDHEALNIIRFIPLVRGAYSLAMVVGAISSSRAVGLMAAYATILLSIIYFASIIFYEQELPVNSDVNTYWSALWWASMNVTTIGCYINPMTAAGKICGFVLAASGMLMLPLFTVFVTDRVKSYNSRHRDNSLFSAIADKKEDKKS